MSDLSAVIPTISMLIGLVLFAGAALVYLRGSKDKGTIDTLQRSNSALAERVTLLEKNEVLMVAQIKELTARNEALEGVANSGEAIAALTASLTEHHTQAMGAWDRIHDDLRDLRGRLDES